MWQEKHTRQLTILTSNFCLKKKKGKERKAKREYNANFLRQQNLADTDSQVISASNFKRHC